MKAMRVPLAIMLSLIIFTSAGCLPKWTVDHVQYGLSNFLYSEDDVDGAPKYIAADGFTYLIVKVELGYNGLAPADIREDLIFKIVDPVPPVVDIENFYIDETYIFYDALKEQFASRGSDTGSVFFMIPDTIDLSRYTFKVMDAAFNLINQASMFYVPQRDYPSQF